MDFHHLSVLIIIAVDGTYSTMKESLCNDGYKSNKMENL